MNCKIPFHPILMHFAARYNGKTYSQFASDHRVLVDSNIRCFEDFQLDSLSELAAQIERYVQFAVGSNLRENV